MGERVKHLLDEMHCWLLPHLAVQMCEPQIVGDAVAIRVFNHHNEKDTLLYISIPMSMEPERAAYMVERMVANITRRREYESG